MRRLFLAALMLVLLSLSVPSLRERAMPRYEAAGSWVWARLEPPLTPLLTPWRRMKTQSEMARITAEMVRRRNIGLPPPDPDALQIFTAHAGIDSTATDVWGTPYHFRIQPDSVFLRSAGQDLELETEDDLLEAIRYASPYRLRRFRP